MADHNSMTSNIFGASVGRNAVAWPPNRNVFTVFRFPIGCAGMLLAPYLRVNPPIGKALAADVLQCMRRTVCVAEAEGLARIPAKVELGRVALQVLLADAMEGAIQATLEHREGRLHRIGGYVATGVLLKGVVHNLVRREVRADLLVHASLIRHQARLLGDLRIHDRTQSLRVHVRKVVRALLAAALDQRHNFHLVVVSARALGVLADVAPVGFVNLDRRTRAAKLAGRLDVHGFADTVRHEPSRLVGHAEHALQLLGANTLLGGTHKVGGIHPLVKGHLRAFKDGADGDGELLAAVAAEQKAGAVARAVQAAIALGAAAVRAHRAIGPAHRFKMLARRVVVSESGFGVNCGFHGFAFGMKP